MTGGRFRRSLAAAVRGVGTAWRTQPNFRAEALIGAGAILAALALRAPLVPIVLVAALVLALELINTAIEATVDLASPEWRPLARRAKDCAAGAVLLASFASLLVGLLTLGPPLLRVFAPA